MALGGTTGMPLADAIRVADRFLYYEKGDISNVVSKGTFLSRNSPCETLRRSFKPSQQLR